MASDSLSKTVLRPGGRSMLGYFQGLVQYKSLIWTLAKRDLKGRFAQSYLGWVWIVLRAGFTLFFFTLIFNHFLSVESEELPYPIFAFSGMVAWYLFSGLTQSTGLSLINSSDLIRKIYFPKLVLPLARSLEVLVELAIHLIILFLGLLVFGVQPSLSWLLVPFLFIPVLLLGLMCGIWLSLFTVRIRDLQYIIPFILNFGIWLTPVFYPVSIVPEQFRPLVYWVNPLVSSLDCIRWAIVPNGQFPILIIPIASILVFFLAVGVFFFQRKDGNMVDTI
ncbi:MAG: lipopolysaccharide transport system permease protein [Granulosicoccus sp.]|jgi:lipopolysaccharide transport system permease protein